MSKVLIHPATYENVRQAIDRVFEIFPQDIREKKVLIKPNLLRASRPEEGIITNPAILRAVVEKVETMRPASIIVGDNPGVFSYGANEEAFRTTGLMDAAKGYYVNIGNDSRNVRFQSRLCAHGEHFQCHSGCRCCYQYAEIQNPWFNDHNRGH